MAKIYFEKAVARAPDSALALVGLSDVIHVMGIRGFTDLTEAHRQAHEIRLRALAMDDTIGELHSSIGTTFLYWEDEFETAGEELRRGAELSPAGGDGTPALRRLAQDRGQAAGGARGDARRRGARARRAVHGGGTGRRADGARPL